MARLTTREGARAEENWGGGEGEKGRDLVFYFRFGGGGDIVALVQANNGIVCLAVWRGKKMQNGQTKRDL